MINETRRIYKTLLNCYGAQGWWPVLSVKTGLSVYGGGLPAGSRVMFEICIGAILTQNVAWKNVEKSLYHLKKARLFSPRRLAEAENGQIASLIRSSGYFNQKVISIKNFLSWFRKYKYSFKYLERMDTQALRNELLSVKGIGPETADSILLYAFGRNIFVVDAYTKRLFTRLGLVEPHWNYDEVQNFFHKKIPSDTYMYNEYHALIVAHGKDFCRKRPLCGTCCLAGLCQNPPSLQRQS